MSDYGLGWIPSHGDYRDRKFAFRSSYADLSELPRRVDWRDKIKNYPEAYDQLSTSSCVGQAIARMFHLRDLIQGDVCAEKPSAAFIYWNARRMEQGGDVTGDYGCQGRSGLKTVLIDGVCSEDEWPLKEGWILAKPFAKCYEEARQHAGLVYRRVDNTSILDLLSALELGPVVGGISVFTSFFTAPNGDADLPTESDSFEGGHMLCFIGYDLDSRRIIFDNSWNGWGRNGRGSIPLDGYACDGDMASDFWMLEKVT